MTSSPHFCPACDREVDAWAPGPGGRPGARCPHCQALERHRFLAYLIRSLPEQLGEVRHILDLAPHRQIRGVLESTFRTARYIGTDLLEPHRAIDVLADITRLPIATGSIDLLICYHVLEHVPDDRAAMRELGRVLSPGGLGLLQVPFRPTAQTDEDPSLPPAERAERFGQADHVRWYGKDFEDRLRGAGLGMARIEPQAALGDDGLAVIGALPQEPVWAVSTGGSEPGLRLDPVRSWIEHAPSLAEPEGGDGRGLDRLREGVQGLFGGR